MARGGCKEEVAKPNYILKDRSESILYPEQWELQLPLEHTETSVGLNF